MIELNIITPIEKIGDLYFKREDKFIPFPEYGHNANGSKLRVCIWLIDEAIKAGAKGVIHGAVTGSPQHVFVSMICKHYGIPCVDVVGSEDIDNHKNLMIAREMGSTFEFCKVGYAKTLEAIAYRLAQEKYQNYFVLETNITLNDDRNSPEKIRKFHEIGAYQALIPENIETLIIPAGSCNSCVSVLFGISLYKPKNLKKIILMGIGNYGSKDPDFISRRLKLIGAEDVFDFPWNKSGLPFTFDDKQYIIEHYDCQKDGYSTYADLFEEEYQGLRFHPRYEAKCWRYMKDHKQNFDKYMNPTTAFWIVGSETTA